MQVPCLITQDATGLIRFVPRYPRQSLALAAALQRAGVPVCRNVDGRREWVTLLRRPR